MASHILIATDLFLSSEIVAQKARELADKFGAKLSIVHTIEFMPITYGNIELTSSLDADFLATLENNARNDLNKLADKYNIPPSNRYLQVGSAKTVVLELAKKLNVDLIVVGSHGRHGIDLLLGSTANSILHGAKCDVLAIRIDNPNAAPSNK